MVKTNIRKIGKIGSYTRMLTLPLFWLEIVGLDVGDFVELSLGKNKELVIKPKRVKNEKKE
ncbi:protein of unknown function [Candidatus Nitrosotalea okcheonensis]|uniref:SpoVT-AbrB domain-containing protein n=1 Tax=Candidatus Nitrosotalea okcheonensis TaxID=1903276 RepID=A0A2H1FEZ5_9ARCH|nr:protein of unknown function [Candidatus Nitrosotalea okcheonensis]